MSLSADSLQPGTALGKYVIDGVLGEGGAAKVYRARHIQLGTTHAVKVLTQASRGMRERLMLEGRVQASLQHPNIVRVVDVDDIDGMPCLVMEFVDGPTLADVLRLKKPTVASTDDLGRQILDAMVYAHEQGLVHRDLKPENILLSLQNGKLVPKIADFGLVKVLDNELSKTRTGSTMGTPLYMSPEQVRCAKNVDHRSDIFSMGTILYTLLTGENPFESHDMFEVFQSIVEGHHVPLSKLHPDLPERMLRTIERAMQLDPDDRFLKSRHMLESWNASPSPETSWNDEFFDTARRLAGSRSMDLTDNGLPTTFPTPAGAGATLSPVAAPVPSGGDTLQQSITEEVDRERPLPWLALVGAGIATLGVVVVGTVLVGLYQTTPSQVEPTSPPIEVVVPDVVAPVTPPEKPEVAVEPPPTEPLVQPSAPSPTPQPVRAPTPAPVVPSPSPSPEPAPVAPVVVAEPSPPEPTTVRTRFVNASPGVRVLLRGASGDHRPGDAPSGAYTLVAFFDDNPTNAGTVTLPEGKTLRVTCKPMLRLCTHTVN